MTATAFHWFWDPTGKWVIFWSSIGACLGYFTAVGIAVRKLNCHSRGCWRLARHHVDGTPYVVCRKHHPDVPDRGATVEEIHAARR